jgi:hypothetical protein
LTALQTEDASSSGNVATNEVSSAILEPGAQQDSVRPIDLAIDSRTIALHGVDTAEDSSSTRSNIQKALDTELSVRDVQVGLARGGVLVERVNRAIQTSGPGRGNAIITVTLDDGGNVEIVELSSGADSEWSNLIRVLRNGAPVRVRMPSGAKGLRVTLKVSAKIQRVSGVDTRKSAVALGANPLSSTFDVVDISGATERLASVRILSEEILR